MTSTHPIPHVGVCPISRVGKVVIALSHAILAAYSFAIGGCKKHFFERIAQSRAILVSTCEAQGLGLAALGIWVVHRHLKLVRVLGQPLREADGAIACQARVLRRRVVRRPARPPHSLGFMRALRGKATRLHVHKKACSPVSQHRTLFNQDWHVNDGMDPEKSKTSADGRICRHGVRSPFPCLRTSLSHTLTRRPVPCLIASHTCNLLQPWCVLSSQALYFCHCRKETQIAVIVGRNHQR